MFCDEHGTVDYCPECDESEKDKRIAELEAEIMSLNNVVGLTENERDAAQATIAELEAQVDWYKVSIEDGGGYLGSLKAENTKLKEAIKTHKGSFIGDEKQGDIVPEDDILWAALGVSDE